MFRRLALVASALLLGVAAADAQAVTPLNSLYYSGGSPPTGYTAQPFQFFCTTGQAACWPLLQIYDGTTRATVNASDSGLTTHIANSSLPVTGTFWQTTQPVSAASLPLPTGAATSALQSTINTTLGSPFQAGGSIGNTSFGISGTVPAPTVASAWGLLAQGGTASGQLGSLALGSVTTAAPSYTTGQTSALSLDTAGNLRVNVVAGGGSGGTSSSFSATFPSTGTAAGAEYLSSPPTLTTGQMVALQTTINGSLHTTVDNTNANGAATAANSAPVTPANNPVGSAAMATGQVSCGTSSTSLVAARTGVAGTGRVSVTVVNSGTTAVEIGNTGVTTTTGVILPGVAGASITLNTTAALFCVASAAETVSFIENY